MAESALATFVVFLWRCFVELMRLSLDLICLLLFIGALCMPWRWPFIPEAVFKMTRSRGDFESHSAGEFYFGVGDAICYVVLLIPLCSGLQTVHLIRRLTDFIDEDATWGKASWWWPAWLSFFMVVADLFMLAFW